MSGSTSDINIAITATDAASAVLNRTSANVAGFSSNINRYISSMNSGLRSYNNAMSGFNRTTRLAMVAAGYAVYKFTSTAITDYKSLEQQHAKTMGAIATNYDKTAKSQAKFYADSKSLKEDAIRAGTTGPTGTGSLYTPAQASSVQTELVKSGLTASDITKNNLTNTVIKFAGGNDLTTSEATEYAVNIAHMYSIKPKNWGKMLDQLSRAADLSTVDVPDIYESLKYAGGITGALNRPITEVLGLITEMGNAGLKGNMAGTGIQALFTKLLAPTAAATNGTAKTAPDTYTSNLLAAFIKSNVKNGKFADMTTVSDNLQKAFGVMNNQEQAWFAKELLGLFQMKAGFNIAKNGGSTLASIEKDLTTKAQGTNDRKWNITMDSSYGKLEKLENMWTGVETDWGYRLSPLVDSIADEFTKFLTKKGNYKIDYNKLDKALKTSSGMISENYGSGLGGVVQSLGSFGLGASQVGGTVAPTAEGIVSSLGKLLGGDPVGAMKTFQSGVSETNKKIEGLPKNLQELGRQARNLIIAFAALSAINFSTQLLEGITTIWKYTLGRTTTAKMSVTAGSVVLQDTGLLDKNGNTIYRKSESTGNPTSTGATILGTDGKPVSKSVANDVQKSMIVDSNGNPISTTDEAAMVSSKSKLLKTGGTAVLGTYSVLEMLGINDAILDKLGVKGQARNVVDTGRSAIDWTIMIAFLDKMLTGGKIVQLLTNILKSPALWPAVAVGAAAGGSVIAAGGGVMLATGVLQDQARADYIDRAFANAKKHGVKAVLTGQSEDWWTKTKEMFTGDYSHDNAVVTVPTKAEENAYKSSLKYKWNGTTVNQAAPTKNWWDNMVTVAGMDGYTAAYAKWKKQQDANNKKANTDSTRFSSAQAIYYGTTGKLLTVDDYNKDINYWKKSKLIDQSTGAESKLVNNESLLKELAKQYNVQMKSDIKIYPSISVSVKLDKNGNITNQSVTLNGSAKVASGQNQQYQIQSSRHTGGGTKKVGSK